MKAYFLTKGRRVIIKTIQDTVDRIKFAGGCYFPDPKSVHSSNTKNSPELIFFDNNALPLNKANKDRERFVSVTDVDTEVLDYYLIDYYLEQISGKNSKGGLGLPSMRTVAIGIFVVLVAFGVYNLWKTGGLSI